MKSPIHIKTALSCFKDSAVSIVKRQPPAIAGATEKVILMGRKRKPPMIE